ncbi:MAG: ribosomal protein S18-alanine N-acetyltransferase [Deltaproteobacteria bacterium]|nr:ribosomal protein S18-alanine N-acetyltransferase [Deltaproteobacteria bacterium]
MSVELATPADAEALGGVLERALPGTWSKRALAAELARPDHEVLIARRAGRAVGLAVVRRALDEAELLLIGVVPEARRCGLGRRLWLTLGARARAAGVERMHLEVRASNASARGFYRSLGFREVGERRRYYQDPTDDAILMTCERLP